MRSTSRGRARIGVLVPFTNTNLEPDMTLMCPEGISLHFTRLGGYDEDEIPDAAQMSALGDSDIDESLRLLNGVKPDAILYGCTSATLTHGLAFDRDLAVKIKAMSGARSITAAGALVFALQSIQVSQIAFASPYVHQINQQAISFLTDAGINTISHAEVAETLDNTGQGAMTPDDVYTLGLQADSPDAEALVLSCTDMRSVEVIDQLEKTLNKPVITSNQAMMFQTLHSLGLKNGSRHFGQLMY